MTRIGKFKFYNLLLLRTSIELYVHSFVIHIPMTVYFLLEAALAAVYVLRDLVKPRVATTKQHLLYILAYRIGTVHSQQTIYTHIYAYVHIKVFTRLRCCRRRIVFVESFPSTFGRCGGVYTHVLIPYMKANQASKRRWMKRNFIGAPCTLQRYAVCVCVWVWLWLT